MADKKIEKRLDRTNIEKNIANSKHEIDMIGNMKADQVKRRDLLAKFIAVREVMHNAAMQNYEYVNPTYKFQVVPEYLAAQKEMAELEFQFDSMKRKDDLEKLNLMLKSFDEQLEQHAKALVDNEAKLAEMGE